MGTSLASKGGRMTASDNKTTALACLQSWVRGDWDATRATLHDDVTFTGPLGSMTGLDSYLEGLEKFAEMVDSVEIRGVVADEQDVCVAYDLVTHTEAGTIPTVGWYQMIDGRI